MTVSSSVSKGVSRPPSKAVSSPRGASWSDQAAAVIANMPNSTILEQTAVANFVDRCVAGGYWGSLDEFGVYGLSSAVDSLKGLKYATAGVAGSTSVKRWPNGWQVSTADAASALRTGWIPSVGASGHPETIAQDRDHFIATWYYSITPVLYRSIMGSSNASPGSLLIDRGGSVGVGINDAAAGSSTATTWTGQSKTLIAGSRQPTDAVGMVRGWVGSASGLGPGFQNTTGIPTTELKVGSHAITGGGLATVGTYGFWSTGRVAVLQNSGFAASVQLLMADLKSTTDYMRILPMVVGDSWSNSGSWMDYTKWLPRQGDGWVNWNDTEDGASHATTYTARGGEKIADFIPRFATMMAAYPTSRGFFLMGGINDMYGGAYTGEQTFANVQAIDALLDSTYSYITAANRVYTTCQPAKGPVGNETTYGWSTAAQARIDAYNALIKPWCASKGYLCIDIASIVGDPTDRDRINPLWNASPTDWQHLNTTGKQVFAAAIDAELFARASA